MTSPDSRNGLKWHCLLSSPASITFSDPDDIICTVEIESRQRKTKKKIKVGKTNQMSYPDLNVIRFSVGEGLF